MSLIKRIAFKPHETRGQEIIKILENMGGANVDNHKGNLPIEWDSAYYIYGDKTIQCGRIDILSKLEYEIYTLEEFEDKFRNLRVS
jgi:hypothetical protein